MPTLTKFALHLSRLAAAAHQQSASAFNHSANTLRGAFGSSTQSAASGASGAAAPGWTQGLSSGASNAGAGAGAGNAKFHAGRGAYYSYYGSHRALTNANATSNDSPSRADDDDETLTVGPVAFSSREWHTRPRRSHSTRGEDRTHHGLSHLAVGLSGLQGQKRYSHVAAIGRSRLLLPGRTAEAEDLVTKSSPSTPIGSRSRANSTLATRPASPHQEEPPPSLLAAAPTDTNVDASKGVAVTRESLQVDSSSLEQDHSDVSQPMFQQLKGARWSKVKDVRELVQQFRRLPRSEQTTATYNMALEALYTSAPNGSAVNDVTDAYVEMIERDIIPNSRTFNLVIRTLCFRDASLLKEIEKYMSAEGMDGKVAAAIEDQGDYYTQALQLLGVAHTSQQMLSTIDAYNDILAACALRGDAERALAVLAYIEANPWVSPNSRTFNWLMKTFANGHALDAEETLEQAQARKLKACKQVFEEFLSVSGSQGREAGGEANTDGLREIEGADSESTAWKDAHCVKVWNALIQAHFDLGDSAGAVGIVERMFDAALGTSGGGGAEAVVPDSSTFSIIIRSFVRSGDIDSAKAWFNKIFAVNAAAIAKGDGVVLPYPSLSALQPLSAAMIDNLKLSEGAEVDISNPDLETLNNIYVVLLQTRMATAGTTTLLNAILRRNASAAAAALPEQSAIVNKLLDRSLQHLHAVHGSEVNVSYASKLAAAHKNNVRSVTSLIPVLVQQQRFADASAALTYAANLVPARADAEGQSTREMLAAEVYAAASQIIGLSTTIVDKAESYEPPSRLPTSPSVLLHLTLQIIVPALSSTIDRNIPNLLKLHINFLWRQATAELGGHMGIVGLAQQDWATLLMCLLYETSRAAPSFEEMQQSGLGLLFHQIAALDSSVRPTLRYGGAMRILIDQYGMSQAVEAIRVVDTHLAAVMKSQPWEAASSASDAGSATAEALSSTGLSESGVSQSTGQQSSYTVASSVATPPLSPIYSQVPPSSAPALEDIPDAPLDGRPAGPTWTPMPMPMPAAPRVADLPPVVSISTELSRTIEQLWSELRPRRQLSRRTGGLKDLDPEVIYSQLLDSVKTGVYPRPQTFLTLMTAYGRQGNIARVQYLYSTAINVVSAYSNDPSRQVEAWCQVEDAMISSLAHAGDADGSSTHRHRLIAAGHVPSANAYAALIATVRDTTDDATIALELFEEAIRLGTQPNVYLFNTVISKLSRARRADRALQLFDMMTGSFKLAPSSVTYGAVINACTRTGDEEGAVRLFNLMEADRSFQPRVPPYNTMIQFFVQHKPDREKALVYYDKLVAHNVPPSAHTYKLLLDMYGCIQPVQEQLLNETFETLVNDRGIAVQGTHWASLITSHGIHRSDLERAQAIFDSIASHPSTAASSAPLPDAVAFEAMLNVFVTHGRIDLMRSHVQRMIDANIRPTAYVANLLIKGYAADLSGAAGVQMARAVFEEMEDPPAGIAAAGNHLPRQHGAGAPSSNSPITRSTEQTPRTPLSGPHGLAGVFREPSTYEQMVRVELGEGGDRNAAEALVQRMVARAFPEALIARVSSLFLESKNSPEPTSTSSP